MASALCAFQHHIPVAHVEAGLRSFNLSAPFPEEANRKIISQIATFNFCPTERAKNNLLRDGIEKSKIFVTGNTVVDALEILRQQHDLDDLEHFDQNVRPPFVLVTAHRRESFGEGFERICSALRRLAREFPGLQFVYPVHMNPNVFGPVHKILGKIANVKLLAPVSYIDLLTLINRCEFVLTDSGGIQEEAPSFRKFCIVMREVTERMESVESGFSELVGTNEKKIIGSVKRVLRNPKTFRRVSNPYGDGKASGRILSILANKL
jgi:UDP-N-acetylglucosamine 2-epimerase (non-hydrolysing)